MAKRFQNPFAFWVDTNSLVQAGAKLEFFESGTSVQLSTFSNEGLTSANANPVVSDAAGQFSDIFLQPRDYKVTLKTSADVLLWTADPVIGNVEGIDLSVETKTANYTIVLADSGKLFLGNATSGGFSFTLPLAATAGDQFRVTIKKIDSSANAVTVTRAGSDTIEGSSITSISLTGEGEIITLASDGSTTWWIVERTSTVSRTRGYIDGMILMNTGVLQREININPGTARDSTDSVDLSFTSAFNKDLDVVWAEGDGNGGRASALTLTGNTWYHVFAIRKTDGSIDGGFDTSITAVNLLADATDYNEYRRVGSVLTNVSLNILDFTQVRDEILWDIPIRDVNVTASPGTSAVFETLSTPLGVRVQAIVSVYASDSSPATRTHLLITSPDQDNSSPSGTIMTMRLPNISVESTNTVRGRWRTDISSRIRRRQDVSSVDHSVLMYTDGWIDDRGKS